MEYSVIKNIYKASDKRIFVLPGLVQHRVLDYKLRHKHYYVTESIK